jgi:hypothetical protein
MPDAVVTGKATIEVVVIRADGTREVVVDDVIITNEIKPTRRLSWHVKKAGK